MITNFIGDAEVVAYLRDFLRRVARLRPIPSIWCPVTPSGKELLQRMLGVVKNDHPELVPMVSVLPIMLDRTNGKMAFGSESPSKDVKGRSVLIFDAAIHSGSTMARAVDEVTGLGAKEICTYALMVKCRSSFIPTMWGLMIDEMDRGYFLLDDIPNHRLTVHSDTPPPSVHIERLGKDYQKWGRVICGVKSMDRASWGDRWFDMAAGEQDRATYLLLRKKNVLGYVTIHRVRRGTMVIDEVAVGQGKRYRGKGYGGILLRFAETLGRQSDCTAIQLHAIENRVNFYEHFGYQLVPVEPLHLDGETYVLMRKPVVRSGPGSLNY